MSHDLHKALLGDHFNSHNIWSMGTTIQRCPRSGHNLLPNHIKHTKITTIFIEESEGLCSRLNSSCISSFRNDGLPHHQVHIVVVGKHMWGLAIVTKWSVVKMCVVYLLILRFTVITNVVFAKVIPISESMNFGKPLVTTLVLLPPQAWSAWSCHACLLNHRVVENWAMTSFQSCIKVIISLTFLASKASRARLRRVPLHTSTSLPINRPLSQYWIAFLS